MAFVLITAGIVAAVSLRWAVSAKDEVIAAHTDVLAGFQSFIADEERASRKMRSYLLTGAPRFREERTRYRERAEAELKELTDKLREPKDKQLVEDIRRQYARLQVDA